MVRLPENRLANFGVYSKGLSVVTTMCIVVADKLSGLFCERALQN